MIYFYNYRLAKRKPLLKAFCKITLFFLSFLAISSGSIAQTNIAPSATVNLSAGGSGPYGKQHLNDGVIPPVNTTTYSWVQEGGFLDYIWTTKKAIGKVVIHLGDRPLKKAIIQYWDGEAFVDVDTYTITSTDTETLTFSPAVPTTILRFNKLTSTVGNPNFREIQVYGGDWVNGAPTALALSASSIDENVAANTSVGSFTTTDPDRGDKFTYTLVSGDGDADNSFFTISGNVLKINVSPDFEAKKTYSIRVRTTDLGPLHYDKIFSITINDVEEGPGVTTAAQQSVTSTSAVLGGEVIDDLGEAVTDRGIVWATTSKPTISNNKISIGAGLGSFSETIKDLPVNTIIYVRSYAINAGGTGYGPEISFSTRNIQSINFDAIAAKTYGDTDFDAGATASSSLALAYSSSDESVATIVGGKVHIVGIGETTITASQGGNEAFDPASSKQQTLVVNKRIIAITAEAKSKTYGDSDPALTFTHSPALVGTDSFSGNLKRETGEGAKTYTIGQGDLALNGNYTLNYTGALLTINKKALTVTAEAKSKTYGDANPVLTLKYKGLVNGETVLSPAPDLTTSASELSPVGEYDIVASGAADNYTITFVGAKLTVNKKLLTVKADDKQKYLSTANPPLTISYSGFANGEGPSALLTQATATTSVQQNTPIGTYDIVASGASSNNYSFDYIKGVFEVKPGHPTSISLAASTVYENQAAGTLAGTLSSTSDDPSATFKYTLVDGFGDRALFEIVGQGTQLTTTGALNFENKSSYSIKVRSTTQHGLWLEKEFTINILNVNEQPTLADIEAETICYTTAPQLVNISGISAGPDANQSTNVTISSSNNSLFEVLEVNQAVNGQAELRYVVNKGASGSAVVNVLVTDDGGTAHGGVNSIMKSFTITVNPLPVVTISSDKGNSISKGDALNLTATGGVSYQWSNAEGILSGQNTATLKVRPSVTTTYRVTATNATNCSEVQEFTVTVNEDYQMVNGTNLVTPNGDNVNDYFVIQNLDMYPNHEVKIFDRAGRLLYSKKNYNSEWNGTFNGAPLAEDTYYYIIDFGAKKPALKGFITIVRD